MNAESLLLAFIAMFGVGFLFGVYMENRLSNAWERGWRDAMHHASTITLNYLKSLKEEEPW